jgi:hypothetical protein
MKLPHAPEAEVSRTKIVNYLLSETHVVGRHKAVLFRALGYDVKRWRALADALKRHAVTKEEPSPFGTRFVIEGIMKTPSGRVPSVRSVWFLRHQGSIPRFVTAYLLKQRSPREPK